MNVNVMHDKVINATKKDDVQHVTRNNNNKMCKCSFLIENVGHLICGWSANNYLSKCLYLHGWGKYAQWNWCDEDVFKQ